MDLTKQVKDQSLAVAEAAGRPVRYLADPSIRKEDLAREIARRDGIDKGLVCVFTAVESCRSFEIHRNRAGKRLELRSQNRRCLHVYHYMIHPQLGFLHARLQTWLPFTLSVCINGREWLAHQMDRAGLGYVRRDNCFIDLANVDRAQALMDRQLKTDWKRTLDGIAALAHPAHEPLFGPRSAYPIDPYWSAQQSEWASDVMFKDPQLLASLYPRLIRQGMETMGSRDVLRFLGKKSWAAASSRCRQSSTGLSVRAAASAPAVPVLPCRGCCTQKKPSSAPSVCSRGMTVVCRPWLCSIDCGARRAGPGGASDRIAGARTAALRPPCSPCGRSCPSNRQTPVTRSSSPSVSCT